MARESRADKAARYFTEDRITVISANEHGIRLSVRGSKAEPYIVTYGRDLKGRVIASCTCEGVADRCSHMEAAKKLRRL
jgi:uncharacterized Zn finger protein